MLELVESHRSYAHALAAEIARALPGHVSREDLDAAAELGLVEAAQAFDSSRGVLFKTFAYYRIRGAVYDAIRKMTWFSKALYDKYRFEMAANEVGADFAESTTAPRNPRDAASSATQLAESITSCYLLSLEAEKPDYADPAAISAERVMIDDEEQHMVRRALALLPEKNRVVLEGYYFEGLNLEEVGARLGLSKSWVCRVHARSIELMREAMLELSARPATAGAGAR
jgi:RNA polymerase sigma factor for flagellar operon FliA